MKSVEQVVNTLVEVYVTSNPTSFVSKDVHLTEQEAYEVQHLTVQKKCERFNEKVTGYKVSMTSPETQAFFDANEPAYGTLTSGTLLPNQATVHLSQLNEPLLEVELLVVLEEDVSVSDSLQDIYEKVSFKPGLEVPDSRFSNWFPKFDLMDLLADNGVTGHVVVPDDSFEKPSFDQVGALEMTLFLDGDEVVNGETSVVLEHPLNSVKWLANKLAESDLSLKKGMTVSSGSINSPVPLKKGRYKAVFENFGIVELTVEN